MNVFSRYAPFIQDYIYRNRWSTLRAVQVAAGDVLFNTDAHLLLSASTASGKTEAAFFPILTLLAEEPPDSVGALYVAPLKALINDQFERLTPLAEEGGIPVWAWHGDVSQSRKERLLKRPRGILQITPESLEALLIRKHADLTRLFGDLRFVVIDEIHSLMRGDRGAQTLCCIERLSRLAGVDPRRVGLSATIGDIEKAAEFLSSGTNRQTIAPKVASAPIRWRLSMAHFFKAGAQAAENANAASRFAGLPTPDCPSTLTAPAPDTAGALAPLDAKTDVAPQDADPGLAYIFEHTRGKKCLVFSNSREEAEAVTSSLRSYCKKRHEPERFLIHHGNLSSSIRESAEADMRDESLRLTTVTTATLELGIDIGKLERAFQIDAPYTVSAFLQRMGRTGRRGSPPEMWFVMREDVPEARDMLPGTIPWRLLQGIAVVDLYAADRWVEPADLERLPYSLLYHQTMSTLLSSGELTPAALAKRVLTLAPFRRISKDDYKALLRHLLNTGHIEHTETGGLIVGLAGERVTGTYKFYAVFKENEEYAVRSSSEELGTIVRPPPVGEKVAIAGRVWTVDEVDLKRRVVYVTLVEGRVPAFFGLCPGDIHTTVLERMHEVLTGTKTYPYLMKNALARLTAARGAAMRADLRHRPLVHLGGRTWCLFPWLGTYAFLALERFLKIKCAARLGLEAFEASRPYFLQFRMNASAADFFEIVADEAAKPFDPLELLYPDENPVFDKYDEFLPAALVRKGFAYGVLGIDEMKARIAGWRQMLSNMPFLYGQANDEPTVDEWPPQTTDFLDVDPMSEIEPGHETQAEVSREKEEDGRAEMTTPDVTPPHYVAKA